MSNSSFVFSEELAARLDLRGISLVAMDSVDSTNNEAKRYVARGEDKKAVLFLAREQTQGRGRLGRSFQSLAGKGIYMSLLACVEYPVSEIVSVTTAAAAAVALSVEELTGARMRIKWVNDVYDERGKVSGILVETVPLGTEIAVIIGIGINVGKCTFEGELANTASSVEALEGREEELIESISAKLLAHLADPCDRAYMEGYKSRFMHTGRRVELSRAGETSRGCETRTGTVLGVDGDGGLIFLPDGRAEPEVIRSGEVTVREQKLR